MRACKRSRKPIIRQKFKFNLEILSTTSRLALVRAAVHELFFCWGKSMAKTTRFSFFFPGKQSQGDEISATIQCETLKINDFVQLYQSQVSPSLTGVNQKKANKLYRTRQSTAARFPKASSHLLQPYNN